MSIGHSNTEPGDLYYECADCGYTTPMDISIGLCPRCGVKLVEKSAFA